MTATIIKEFIKLNYLDSSANGQNNLDYLNNISELELQSYAENLALNRDYPASLSNRNVAQKK